MKIHEFYELNALKFDSLNLNARLYSHSFNSRAQRLIRVQKIHIPALGSKVTLLRSLPLFPPSLPLAIYPNFILIGARLFHH
jgi:hypothetical protein